MLTTSLGSAVVELVKTPPSLSDLRVDEVLSPNVANDKVEIAVPLDIAGAGPMGEIIGLRQLVGGIGQPARRR